VLLNSFLNRRNLNESAAFLNYEARRFILPERIATTLNRARLRCFGFALSLPFSYLRCATGHSGDGQEYGKSVFVNFRLLHGDHFPGTGLVSELVNWSRV